jgi:hypothetical protein
MLRLPSKRASLLIVAFPMLILGGCSDSLTSSPSSFTSSTKQLGKTLTPAEQRAAIADLEGETKKRESASAKAAPTAKPAEAQN